MFDKPPSRLCLSAHFGRGLKNAKTLVRQHHVSLFASAGNLEKPYRKLAAIHIVKRFEYIRKASRYRRIDELSLIDGSRVISRTCLDERSRPSRCLFSATSICSHI